MWKLLLLLGMPLAGLAQTLAPAWGGGLGVGNGVEAHAGYQRPGWSPLARVRYHWRGPAAGPGSGWLDDTNTDSRQLEVAALGVYTISLGKKLLYGGLGVSYLNGRQLGDYRYTVRQSGLLGSATYYYSYRDYQALGLPVEVSLLSGSRSNVRLGLSFQANFNPEKTQYCGMLTFWLGAFGRPAH